MEPKDTVNTYLPLPGSHGPGGCGATDPLVDAVDLWKVYPGGVEAVRGVSFRAGRGVHVLMGPNGSGKTTTLSMVAGALRPTRGTVRVCGLDVWGRDWSRPRECLGFAPQKTPFRERLTGLENLVWYGLLRGLSIGESRRRARELAGELGLSGALGRRVSSYSGGMRKRLAVAAALMGDPEVLVLDEPTSGLDPAARLQFWRLLRRLARDRCVLVSTHIPSEAEEHADTVLVFHRGRVVAAGPPRRLIEEHAPLPVIVVEGRLPPEPLRVPGAKIAQWGPGAARVQARDPESLLPRLVEALAGLGARVERVEVRRPGLGEVYLALTGEAIGGGGGAG